MEYLILILCDFSKNSCASAFYSFIYIEDGDGEVKTNIIKLYLVFFICFDLCGFGLYLCVLFPHNQLINSCFFEKPFEKILKERKINQVEYTLQIMHLLPPNTTNNSEEKAKIRTENVSYVTF